jgi:hypothetical protein
MQQATALCSHAHYVQAEELLNLNQNRYLHGYAYEPGFGLTSNLLPDIPSSLARVKKDKHDCLSFVLLTFSLWD